MIIKLLRSVKCSKIIASDTFLNVVHVIENESCKTACSRCVCVCVSVFMFFYPIRDFNQSHGDLCHCVDLN